MKTTFPKVFDMSSPLREMAGGLKIELTDDVVPFAARTPRTIPFCWREEVRKQLDDLVQKGIIEPVRHPTLWCHPLVPVPTTSEDGSVSGCRLTVDFTRLSKQVRQKTCSSREKHARRSRIDRDRSKVLHEAGREGWVPPDTHPRRRSGLNHVHLTVGTLPLQESCYESRVLRGHLQPARRPSSGRRTTHL